MNSLVAIGPPGQKTCYLNTPTPRAIEAWRAENAGQEPTGDMISWFSFETAFAASNVWPDRE